MIPALYYEIFFAVTAFAIGACIGSFLNVAIHRLPRGLAVNEPARSFCPHCKKLIPGYRNIPLFTWLAQRGKGACCGQPIAARYFLVELLTAGLFLTCYLVFPLTLAIPFAVLLSLLVAGSFIDLEHYIIPDEITWGMMVTGLFIAFANPAIHAVVPADLVPWTIAFEPRILALGYAAFGALLGYFSIWIVIEGGKKVFGKKRIRLESARTLRWEREGDDAKLWLNDPKNKEDEEPDQWSEIFSRPSDRLILVGKGFSLLHNDGKSETLKADQVSASWEKLYVGDRDFALDELKEIHGEVTSLVMPREAMGLGDAKLMAGVGAFLGWKAVFFSIFAGSILGTLLVVGFALLSRREVTQKIPFGPYLAAGAVIWMFFGEAIVTWYANLLAPPGL